MTFHLFRSCMPTHLVWFRRDSRLQDNLLVLAAACRDVSARVLALIFPPPRSGRPMIWRRAAGGIHQRVQLNALQTARYRHSAAVS